MRVREKIANFQRKEPENWCKNSLFVNLLHGVLAKETCLQKIQNSLPASVFPGK